MAAGAAFAKFMEHAKDGPVDSATVDGWTFNFALDEEIALPPVRELKAEVVFETPHGLVTLVGKTDGIDGAIHDQKLTESLDAERYTDSLQWRCYLVMFKAQEFVYDVFLAKYERGRGRTVVDADGEETYVKGEPTGTITVTEYHPLRFYAYPEMRQHVEAAVRELAEVIAAFVPQKVTPDVAETKGAA
jgi:hypothetical protein